MFKYNIDNKIKFCNVTDVRNKCGEVFCKSTEEFIIFCTLCEMKSLTFSDFLHHIQNTHLSTEILDIYARNISYRSISDKSNTSIEELNFNNNSIDIELTNQSEQIQIDNVSWKERLYKDEDPLILLKNTEITKTKTKGNTKYLSYGSNTNNKTTDSNDYLPNEKRKKTAENEKSNEIRRIYQSNNLEDVNIDRYEGTEISTNWFCEECLKIFHDRKNRDQHCLDDHGGFKCTECDKHFKQYYQRKRHEQTHMTKKTFLCDFEGCNKSFTESYYLKRHQDVHKTERDFLCDFENCNKAFHTQRRLIAHKKIHTKPKNLICDKCGYSCRENETLRIHQRIHTGEKPYPCSVCNKRFISSSSLGEHMATHAKCRPYICKICNASFARQKGLYHHNFLHLEIRKFQCKICGCAYKQAAGLAGHMRKHRVDLVVSPIIDKEFN